MGPESLLGALAQVLILASITGLAVRSYPGDRYKQALAALLLFWASLCSTAYALASLSLLGHRWIYAATSVVVAATLALAFRWLTRRQSPCHRDQSLPSALPREADRISRVLGGAGLVIVAAAFLTIVAIAVFYDPTNDDSLTYRFPRVMYYLTQGNLGHIRTADPRLDYYPLCGAFLYFLPGTWALDGRAFNVASLVMWLAGGVAVVATARQIGASRSAAWIAAVLYLTAPAVFVSAASTNDDMIAGVPTLCGILFALCWWRSRGRADAVLTGLGFGLSLGTKYQLFLYDIAILAAAIAVVILPKLRTLALRTVRDGWPHMLLAGAVAAFFVLPGLAINLVQGHALLRPPTTGPEFSPFDGVANSPFSAVVAGINVAITLAQLFLGDLPNTLFSLPDAARRNAVDIYDAVINRHLFWWLPGSIPYNIPYYSFAGVTSPEVGYAASEASVWLGLLPWLLAVTALLCARFALARAGAIVALCLAISLFLRFVSFGLHFRYGESAGIYGAFAIAIAAPALAWAWDARRLVSAPMRGAIVVLWCAALMVNVAIGVDAAIRNPARNLSRLVATGFSELQRKPVAPELAAALAGMDRVDIIYTHYELEAFSLMMANMRARYASRLSPTTEPGHSELYSYPVDARAGNVPLLVADEAPDRLALLGSYSGVGRELVFGTGARPSALGRPQGGYVVMRLAFDVAPDNADIVRKVGVAGLVGARPGDDLEYSLVQITPSSGRHVLLDWTGAGSLPTKPVAEIPRFTSAPPPPLMVPLAEPSSRGYIAVRLRPRARPEDVSQTWVPLERSGTIVPPRASTPDYRLSATIDFRMGGGADEVEGPGWSTAETSGTWSTGSESVLDLRLGSAPDRPLRLTAKVLPFLAAPRARAEVAVLANDVQVATWTFDRTDWADMTADIPPSIFAGKRDLRLSFVSQDVTSPAKLRVGADTRLLKLLFATAAVGNLPSGSSPNADYAPGTVITFTPAGEGGRYTADGWSAPEPTGTWSLGAASTMRFSVRPTPRAPLRLSAEVMPFVPPGRTTSVGVSANGTPVATWTFNATVPADVTAVIPAAIIGPDGRLDLAFTAEGVVSPAAAGVSADTRSLKLMMRRLDMSEER